MKNDSIISFLDEFLDEFVNFLNSSNLSHSSMLLSLIRISHLFLLLKQDKKAEKIINEVSIKLTKLKDPETLSRLYFEIGLFYRKTKKEEMDKYFEQAISLSEKLDKETRASLFDEYSIRLAELGEKDAALAIASKIPIEKLRLITLYDLWSMGIKTPETEKARNTLLNEYLESDDLFLRYFALLQTKTEKISPNEVLLASPEDSSQILIFLASKLLEEGKIDEAITSLNQALTMAEKCEDALLKSQILLEIAHLKMSANLESEEIVAKAIETVDSYSPLIKVTTLLKAAEIYRSSGKVLRADKYIRRAIKLSAKEKSSYYRFLILEQIANHLIDKEISDMLIKTLQKMLQTIKRIRNSEQLEDAVLRFSELFLNFEKIYRANS